MRAPANTRPRHQNDNIYYNYYHVVRVCFLGFLFVDTGFVCVFFTDAYKIVESLVVFVWCRHFVCIYVVRFMLTFVCRIRQSTEPDGRAGHFP